VRHRAGTPGSVSANEELLDLLVGADASVWRWHTMWAYSISDSATDRCNYNTIAPSCVLRHISAAFLF